MLTVALTEQLKGLKTYDSKNGVDCNTIKSNGVYYVSNPTKDLNYPVTNWGTLVVFQGGTNTVQFYFTDAGANYLRQRIRVNNVETWQSWKQLTLA